MTKPKKQQQKKPTSGSGCAAESKCSIFWVAGHIFDANYQRAERKWKKNMIQYIWMTEIKTEKKRQMLAVHKMVKPVIYNIV